MLRLVMPQTLTVVVDIVAWGAFHALTGYAAHRLDDRRLARDGWLLRQRRFEDGGRWYRRRLRIHRWKDRLPEAGDLFRGGMSKRQLPAYDVAGLKVFARETRRPSWRTGGRCAAGRSSSCGTRRWRPRCSSPTACWSTCRSSRSSATTGSGSSPCSGRIGS